MPSTNLPVRLDQRFAIDPRSPSFDHLAMSKVTTLEPRTPHQPGKLQKLSKNEFVLLLSFLESIKMPEVYVLYQQASARHPQPGELNVVQRGRNGCLRASGTLIFAGIQSAVPKIGRFRVTGCDCVNRSENLAGQGSSAFSVFNSPEAGRYLRSLKGILGLFFDCLTHDFG